MTYPLAPFTTRTATLNSTPIQKVMVRGGDGFPAPHRNSTAWSEAANDADGFSNGATNAAFWVSWANTDSPTRLTLTAVQNYGMNQGDYAKRSVGTLTSTNGVSMCRYADGVLRITNTRHLGWTQDISLESYTVRYATVTGISDFTSGEQTITLPTFSSATLDFGDTISQKHYDNGGVTLKDSSPSNPKVGQFFAASFSNPSSLDYRVWLIQYDNSGITLRRAFDFSPYTDEPGWFANGPLCTGFDGTAHYTLFQYDINSVQLIIWNPTDDPDPIEQAVYTVDFDDPQLNYALNSSGTIKNIKATQDGFVMSAKVLDTETYSTFVGWRHVLISLDWTSYQDIELTTEDSVVQDFLDAGPDALLKDVTIDDAGVYYLDDRGSSQGTFYAYSVEATAPGNTDDDIRLRVWTFSLDGHDYFVLRIGLTETLVYDLTTSQWSHWASPDEEIWRAHVGQNWIGIGPTTVARGFGTDIVAGDDRTGILWMLDPSVGLDDDPVDGQPAVAFERKVTGGIQLSGRETRPCGAIQLTTAMGNPQETGASYTLRISDDHGNTWLNCGSVATVAGNYRTVVEWRGLGLMKAPGRVFEVSDSGASVRLSRLDLR